jgi:hypothetical protein
LILILGEENPDLHETAAGEISFRKADSIDTVLGWIESEPIERVVVPYPPKNNFNPFSLARRLKRIHGPPMVLAGELRLDTQFWAERNGCEVARSVEDAIEK